MKPLKIVLFFATALLALLLVGVVLALTPAVQTWAVRKVLDGQPEAGVSVGRISAGLSGAEIAGLRIEQPGMSLQLERASARFSALRLLSSGRIDLDEVVAEGIELDLRQSPASGSPTSAGGPPPRPSTTASSPPAEAPKGGPEAEPFAGVLKSVSLPPGFRLGRLSVAGRVLFPEDQAASFVLRGGEVVAGGVARLEWETTFTDASAGAALRSLRTEGRGTAEIEADGTVRRMTADATVRVDGEALPTDVLRADAVVGRNDAAGETYRVRLSRIAADSEEPLLGVDGAFDAERASVEGTWNLTLQGPAIAALLAGLDLPELAVEGDGTFGAQTNTGAFNAAGRARGRMARLSVLSPALAQVDAVSFETDFEARGDGENVSLARFELAVGTTAGVPLALVRTLQPVSFLTGGQRLVFERPEEDLGRVVLRAVPLAWLQPFAGPLTIGSGTVTLDLAVAASADGGRVSLRGGQPLEIRDLDLGGPDGPLAAGLDLSVYPIVDYSEGRLRAEFGRLEIALDAGDRVGGILRADVSEVFSNPSADFSGELDGNLVTVHTAHVPVETGPLGFSLAFQGNHAAGFLALQKADVIVRRSGDAMLAEAGLRAPFRLNLETLAFEQAPGLAAAVTLGRLPLAWVEPFVDGLDVSGEVTGGAFEVIATSWSDVAVNTLAPVAFGGVDLSRAGTPAVRGLDGSIDGRATLRGATLAYEVRRAEFLQARTSLARVTAAGELDFGGETLRLASRGELSIGAAALRQPILQPYATLAEGRLAATFDATLGDGLKATAVVTGRQLVAGKEKRALGDVDLDVALTLSPDGSGTVSIPLNVAADGRVSDLKADGSFARRESGLAFDGRLTGQRVIVDDLRAFAALAPDGSPASSPAPVSRVPEGTSRPGGESPAPATKDTEPFWKGVAGRAEVDLKNVVQGPQATFADLRGILKLDETRLALENLAGRMNDKPFALNGTVTFDGREAKPYALSGDTNVADFDLGAFLASANPGEKPAIETKVTAAGRFAGRGANLDDLLQHVQGSFDVQGSGGVLRALGRRGEAVGAISTLVGLIGAARGSATTVATAELASQLNELRFDRVTFKLERGADLDVKLTAMEFLSPTSRVTGSGTISYREGVPLARQPLHLQLALAGKGALAQVLNRAGLLNGNQDDREYYTVSRAFSISGTPLVPDSGDLWRFVAEAALRAATAPRAAPESGGTPPAGQPTGAPPR